ncbi:hypothetical protein EVAR_26083_1 [Eumeta japonica]|uniref:Uncharacterized protein n=1 Tax=Eumeta variegata TaxID=151549 RepID=A0A4C1WZH6_EUMVA|nr:hypothetical protein EVAR_26083_1 [Eumeta japonica]
MGQLDRLISTKTLKITMINNSKQNQLALCAHCAGRRGGRGGACGQAGRGAALRDTMPRGSLARSAPY